MVVSIVVTLGSGSGQVILMGVGPCSWAHAELLHLSPHAL